MTLAIPDAIRACLGERAPVRRTEHQYVAAAVLIPLFAEGHEVRVWLVRRAIHLRTHQGQVALPGGKCDSTDRDRRHTALREAHEEIGLAPNDVDVLGVLDDRVTITDYVITPVVGWLHNPFAPVPLASEVAHVFSVPLVLFETPPELVTVDRGFGMGRRVLAHRHQGETIWGTTAAILRALAVQLRPIVPKSP